MLTPIEVSTQTKPLCPLFGTCGGCQYQDIPYEAELSRKEAILKELLMKELALPEAVFEPITSSPEVYHYRNRLDLTLRKRNNGERQMGFMLPATQRLQEVTTCSIARREINDFIPALKEEAVRRLPEDYKTANLVVRVGDEGKVFWGGIGRRSLRMKPEDYFWTVVKGRRIFYALDTFFQANLSILGKIVARIEGLIEWQKETVFLDLYSGVGLFGIALADRAKEVVMIEEVGDSVTLARFNVSYHKMEHVKMLVGKVEIHLPEVLKELDGKPCVALIDPPRGGLASSAIETLGAAKDLASLFYLSCSPESLARDLKHLAKVGWKVRKIMPFDFFPRTRHLETLVWLMRQG
jgi:23S rRNA (uracil1939-C5)-methyltransferase/tRNA (uracil-5-)-methyltransferase